MIVLRDCVTGSWLGWYLCRIVPTVRWCTTTVAVAGQEAPYPIISNISVLSRIHRAWVQSKIGVSARKYCPLFQSGSLKFVLSADIRLLGREMFCRQVIPVTLYKLPLLYPADGCYSQNHTD